MFKNIFIAIKTLWYYAKLATLIQFLQVIVIATMMPLSLIFTKNLLNSLAVYDNVELDFFAIGWWAGLLIISIFLIASSAFINSVQTINLKRSLDQEFSQHIMEKYRRIAYACFEDSKIQDTLNRMGNAPQDLILNTFQDAMATLAALISTLGIIVIFWQISWLLPLIFSLIIPFMLWSDYRAMKIMNEMFSTQTQDERKLAYYSKLLSEKNSLLELKVFAAIDYVINLWKIKHKIVLTERIKTTIRAEHYLSISMISILLWVGSLLFVMIQGIRAETLSLGLFVALIGSIGSLLNVSERLSYHGSNLARHYLQVQFYTDFMALPEIPTVTSRVTLPTEAGEIRFHEVYFCYPNSDKQILKGVSFRVNAGEKLAIVGENGAGKSTIIKLLCRLYQPDAGYITINDININELTQTQLSQVISVIFQDFFHYDLSLRENIALGNVAYLKDDAKIYQALGESQLMDLTLQLDTPLGKIEDDGIDLSGGQWQRVAMARALFSHRAWVILDEPTAALDPIMESEIYQSFATMLHQRGAIIISHRLASAKIADKILLIANGMVAESGNHQELLAKKGYYATMWQVQSSWYQREVDHEI